ncbi:type 1 glutamine amidotransferase [Streptomyces sp. 8L]|uniref:type 1 glutamine amidotransferase n=1 Tax=Streptomyces sp. 8L TaxID=2877242 RepID=UPI001CD497F2|nr:type 1 glutamine amidotransferase [Streptomyces sp. 8L]MCA1222774.1 type 1 glutamine amidotransferase [Streptomyces sp. 8L]
MDVLVVQHVPGEETYAIGEALRARGLRLRVCRMWEGDPLPSGLAGVRALVVMGGPASAYGDDSAFPTRAAEIALLRTALARRVPVLGVCLGAQLLAVAAGTRGRPGDGLQVGWGPVRVRARAAQDPLFADAPARLGVLHWHGDTVDLPSDAVLLASCDRYAAQAFRIGGAAWGLQFHVEVDAAAVEMFAAAFPGDAATAPGLRAETPGALAALAPHRDVLLGRFADLVAAR